MSYKTASARMALASAAASALPLLMNTGMANAQTRAPLANPPAASTLSEAPVETLLKWADADRSKGECLHAIGLYGQVLENNPHNAAALMGRGKAFLARREFDKALQDYNKATEFAPQSAEAFYGRATVRLMMQEAEEQIAVLSAGGEGSATAGDSSASFPATSVAPALNGSQFDREGTVRSCKLSAADGTAKKARTHQIIADLDKAAHLNPRLASIWFRKATVCEAAGHTDEAKAAYSEYLARATNKNGLAWSQARLAALSAN